MLNLGRRLSMGKEGIIGLDLGRGNEIKINNVIIIAEIRLKGRLLFLEPKELLLKFNHLC